MRQASARGCCRRSAARSKRPSTSAEQSPLTTEVPSRTFDAIYSCSSFEHFADPAHVLTLMRERLKPDGLLVIAFAEPWFSPRGHHMSDFTRLPWVNVLFREADVMTVRASYHPDGATRYEDVEGGLKSHDRGTVRAPDA